MRDKSSHIPSCVRLPDAPSGDSSNSKKGFVITSSFTQGKPHATDLRPYVAWWPGFGLRSYGVHSRAMVWGVLSFDLESTFRSTYRFDKLTALRLSKGRVSTGGPSSLRV